MSYQGDKFTEIADAIREKKGTTDPIKASDFANEIAGISTGITPTGTIEITENGRYNVTDYASAVVSVTTSGGRGFDIELPTAFASSANVYYFQVDDDTILFSSNLTSIWSYNISSNSWQQIYTSGIDFKSFQIIGDECLIASNSSAGVVKYQLNEKNIVAVLGVSIANLVPVENGCLMFGLYATGVYFYDATTKSQSQVYATGKWNYYKIIGDNCIIGSYSNNGILIYNIIDKTFNNLYTTGNWTYFYEVGQYVLISSNSSSYAGILLYDLINNTITKKFTSGHSWRYVTKVGDNALISSNTSAATGILLFTFSDTSITKKFTSGFAWTNVLKVGDNALISSSVSSNTGVLLYNSSTLAITKQYAGGYFFDILEEDNGNYYILSSDISRNARVMSYDTSKHLVKLVKYNLGVI